MYLIALAIAPGVAIMFYMYSKDKYDREPFKNLFISFLLGILSTIPAIIIQKFFQPQLAFFFQTKSISYYALFAYAVVGFGEELSKFIMVRYYAYRKQAFNEPFDGIIYSVMVSMGFATLENIGYVSDGGYATALLRMFLSVPAHASFGVLMGYHIGLAKFDAHNSATHLWKGLLLAAFFHGSFDFFLFLQESTEVTQYVSTALLFAGALVSYWIAIRLSLRSIRQHQDLSKQEYNRRNNII
ncbi:MAG: PrsW family intramembrane metalloprotease [Chitinophagaceae bacterium]